MLFEYDLVVILIRRYVTWSDWYTKLFQNGDPMYVKSSTKTLLAFPTVSGIGRAKTLEELPAVPTVWRWDK